MALMRSITYTVLAILSNFHVWDLAYSVTNVLDLAYSVTNG